MKSIFIIIVMLFCIVANAQTEECEVPGKTMHWIADYCMHQAETDDFQEKRVQACFEKHHGYEIKDTCENRKKYKMKLCQHLVDMRFYDGDVEMCFKDKDFIPATVRNGGI
jgi:hypothetical protein